MKKSVILAFLMLFFFSSAWCYATPSHDIMQKIAAESLVDISGEQPCSFKLPGAWTVRRAGKEKISFTVPYHAGVMGVIEARTEDVSLDEAVKYVEGTFKSEFSTIEQGAFEQGGVTGVRAVLSGRLGGEIWRLLIFSGKVSSEKRVIYYAAAPERWFSAYCLLFDDTLKSMH